MEASVKARFSLVPSHISRMCLCCAVFHIATLKEASEMRSRGRPLSFRFHFNDQNDKKKCDLPTHLNISPSGLHARFWDTLLGITGRYSIVSMCSAVLYIYIGFACHSF